MEQTGKIWLITVLVLGAIGLVGAYYDVEHKVDELADEVRDLKESMKKTSDQVQKIYKFTNKVEKAFFAVNGVNISQGHTDSDKLVPITVQEIRREPLGSNETRYVIQYVKSANGGVCTAVIPPNDWRQPAITVIEGPVEEASLTIQEGFKHGGLSYGWNSVWFLFYDGTMETGVSVQVGPPNDESSIDERIVLSNDDFQVPGIVIDPPKDIVYEEGYDVEATVTLKKPNNEHLSRHDIHTNAYFYDLDKEKFMSILFDLGNYTVIEEPKNVTSGIQFGVTLKTSQHRVSGLIEVTRSNSTEVSILKSISVSRAVYLRPSSQPGPFPKHTVGFLHNGYTNYEFEDGAEVSVCDVDSSGKCRGQCLAIGDNIFGVMVQRILPDGTKLPIRKRERWGNNYRYLKATDFNVTVPTEDKMDESQRFVCTATSFEGDTATKELLIKFVKETNIIVNSTTAKVTQNGTENIVRLECSATGKPLPNITFDLNFDYDYQSNTPADETLVSDDGLKITGSITVTSNPDGQDKGRLYSAYCNAMSRYGGQDVEEIKVPDTAY